MSSSTETGREGTSLGSNASSSPARSAMSASAASTERRRVREVRKYLAPSLTGTEIETTIPHTSIAAAISGIGSTDVSSPNTTLTALVQLITWRLGMQRAMVSVVDENAQYFLAESTKTLVLNDGTRHEDGDALWMALCANTIEQDAGTDKYACFYVTDLSKDDRFHQLPYVVKFPNFRFYAGTPLMTRSGVPIGSVFVIDDRPRGPPTKDEVDFLGVMAHNVMEYLEMRRENEMKVRVDTMSRGMAALVNGKASLDTNSTIPPLEHVPAHCENPSSINQSGSTTRRESIQQNELSRERHLIKSGEAPMEWDYSSSEDTAFRKAIPGASMEEDGSQGDEQLFSRGANILRESFDVSYTVFLDARVGNSTPVDEVVATDTPIQDGIIARENKSSDWMNNSSITPEEALLEHSRLPTAEQQWGDATATAATSANRQASVSKNANILAFSTEKSPFSLPKQSSGVSPLFHPPEQRLLRRLLRRYPTGKLWTFNGYGDDSSEEEQDERSLSSSSAPSLGVKSLPSREKEIKFLMACFPNATQVLYAPLYEAASASHIAACFAVSVKPEPVFTTQTESAYMRAYMNSISVAYGLASSKASNKQKGAFISSISHELRSPLHGITAAVDLLAGTTLDKHQQEYCDIITTCGQVLLETISDILEYTKINSLRKDVRGLLRSSAEDVSSVSINEETTLLRMLAEEPASLISDVSLLCEAAVSVVAAAHVLSTLNSEKLLHQFYLLPGATTIVDGRITETRKGSVPIILDISQADWEFVCLSGAFQRIVMNLVGNSLKFTDSGFIQIHLSINAPNGDGEHAHQQVTSKKEVVLSVRDSGKGIGSDFLKNKLFRPFSQESVLDPGTGLGLHIVRNLVQMHNGTVHVKSQVGHGTSVTVALPLMKPLHGHASKDGKHSMAASDSGKLSANVLAVRKLLTKGTFAIRGFTSNTSSLIRDSLQRYLTQWFEMSAVSISGPDDHTTPEIVIIDEETLSGYLIQPGGADALFHLFKSRLIIVCDPTRQPQLFQHISKYELAAEILTTPFGPHKLCRVLLASMETPVLPSTGALIASHVEEDKTPKSEKANKSPPALSATPLSKRPHSERFAHPALSFPAPSPSPALKILRSGVHHQPIVDDIAALEVPIILPLRPRVSDAITPAHEVLTSPNTKDANRTRILCVDDNPINLRLLKSYLERLNYVDITCATDGAVAFEAVRCHPDGFELIFMDLTMPVLDGFACTTLTRGLEKLMQRMPRAPVTPRSEGLGNTGEGEKQQDRATLTNRKIYDGRALIVALTGLASQKDQDAASAAGADFFITKPLRLVRLKELLKEWGFALPLG